LRPIIRNDLEKLALEAIIQNLITPIFPEDLSLDTEFKHGGMSLTWGKIVSTALEQVERYDPARYGWTQQWIFDAAVFDKWLKSALQARHIPAHSKRRAGAKSIKRDGVADLIAKEYPSGIPAGVTDKKIANDYKAKTRSDVSERTVRRARGRK
jgi:hypothetical protein